MNELSITIEELRECGQRLIEIANSLTRLSSSKPEISLEVVRQVLADKSRSGFTKEVRNLLIKYGANKLSEINPSDYETLLNDAEEIK